MRQEKNEEATVVPMELNWALVESTFYVIHSYYTAAKIIYYCLPL